MKRIALISLISVLFAVSCVNTNEELDNFIGRKIDSFTARIDNDHTRTHSTLMEDGTLRLYWHKDDCVAVTDGEQIAKFTLDSGEDSATATFVVATESEGVAFPEGKTLYGVSPYSAATLYTDIYEAGLEPLIIENIEWDDDNATTMSTEPEFGGVVFVNIPTEQTYTGVVAENDLDRNIMVGLTADNGRSFDFTMVASVARFSLTVDQSDIISSVKMIAQDATLAGAARVDIANIAIDAASSRSVMLKYATPQTGSTDEGWALITPVDWRQSKGKVLYQVATNRGLYTFCKRPTKSFKPGHIYNFPLSIEKFRRVASLEELEDGCYTFESNVVVKQVASTDSTISIAWTISPENITYLDSVEPCKESDFTYDKSHTYRVALYRDAACSDLVVSAGDIDGKVFHQQLYPPRFIFPGLNPQTTYFAKVWDTTYNTVSATIEVSTKASVADKSAVVSQNAKAGDLILYENFASLVYAGDITSRAAGLSHNKRSEMTELQPVAGNITLSGDGFYAVSCDTEINLFSTIAGLVDDFGMSNWGWVPGSASASASSVSVRSGFIKMGTTSNRAHLATPALTAIPEGKVATLKVVFKALPYAQASKYNVNETERFVAVRALADPVLGNQNKVTYSHVASDVSFEMTSEVASDWREYTAILTGVPAGAAISIGGGAASATATNRIFLDDLRIYVEAIESAPAAGVATGIVTYDDGSPAAGVSVSDGFSVVQTDANGKYTLKPNANAWYIFYTIPADCQVPVNNYGQPAFFTKYDKQRTSYNFVLKRLPGGKEKRFSLFCLADPQCKNATQRTRFMNESVPAIKAHAEQKGVPCYGVTLGDVAYSEGNRNCESQMPYLRDHMAKSAIGMPIFQTMGNHDYTYFSAGSPLELEEGTTDIHIMAQRSFEDIFGPINYSWDRGDAHIVCMRNMHWFNQTDAANYAMCYTDEQVEWLRQDLATVPKDKLLIYCVHIPVCSATSNNNVQNVISLINKFKETHVMSGHTHYNRNDTALSGTSTYEHIHGAVCGVWWYSNVNGDGTPNGYGVYDINGSTITNWYYQGVNEGMNDRNYQLRLYRGNLKCGGEHEQIELQHGDGVILANVFNADSSWSIKVYENGVYSGTMTKIATKSIQPTAGSPTKPGTDSSQDWWAIGYHIGVVGRGYVGGNRSSYLISCYHMYKYTLKDKTATVRVEATDRFGRTYSATQFTGDYDYSLME